MAGITFPREGLELNPYLDVCRAAGLTLPPQGTALVLKAQIAQGSPAWGWGQWGSGAAGM